MAGLSPMMEQYFQIKQNYADTLLFFRLGDFYEMFFEDAKIASKELELVLTGRDCGQEERAPMCGVPFHSADSYIAKLVSRGYKVAICEQVEDPATAKGIVKRDVVRIVTPGTVIESSMLDEGKNNFLASVYITDKSCGAAFVDAIDIDPWSAESATRAAELNGVSNNINIITGTVEAIEGKTYDAIYANINRNIILGDIARYTAALNAGGSLLVSGFLTEDVEYITSAAAAHNLTLTTQLEEEGWVAIAFQKAQ